jgi:3-oxoacyl-[acyl-carrier-protein] synthase-1
MSAGVSTAGLPARTAVTGRAETPHILALCSAALEQLRPAVKEALTRWGPDRVAVCAGSCDNGTEYSLPAHRRFFTAGAFPSGYDLACQGAAGPAEYAARFFGITGPVLALAAACASSAAAIIRAAELIRAGICDAAVVGGADIVSDTVLLGFTALEAISDEPCNPFSKNRNGINLGEGASFFVLSREKLWPPGIILAGYGESADAYHMTSPHPEGTGAVKAMEAALEAAFENPEGKTRSCSPDRIPAGTAEIAYVNLHGTGTFLNDQTEALAMQTVFGGRQPPASSTKPVTGHTLGAAGALELALCWKVLEAAGLSRGALPVHCWDGVRDEALPELRLVPPPGENAGLEAAEKIRYCMSNSFAFGGANISLILGRENAETSRTTW